jgi:hypothetical protein
LNPEVNKKKIMEALPIFSILNKIRTSIPLFGISAQIGTSKEANECEEGKQFSKKHL